MKALVQGLRQGQGGLSHRQHQLSAVSRRKHKTLSCVDIPVVNKGKPLSTQ